MTHERTSIRNIESLTTRFPSLANEWHPTKNGDLLPSDVLPGSNRYAWWICANRHEWRARTNNRTQTLSTCPYCAGRLPIKGVNDLESCFPNIAAEWHPVKNAPILPSDVLPKSNKRVFWKCSSGHEWSAKIYHRTEGRGCPYCAGIKPIIGVSDLQTVNPLLAKEWHPTKNGTKKPEDYTPWSHKTVWWRCCLSHEWQASVSSRTDGRGCPICSGRVTLAGFNDLISLAPYLATEWDYDANGDLCPEHVTLHSNKKVWWKCSEGHSWQAKINNRANGSGCPYCNQHKLIPEETSLAVIAPQLAEQWDSVRNTPTTPKDVTAYCNRAYWWKCEQGHGWKATVSNRRIGTGCPYCRGHSAIDGENDLKTLYPELARQWHPGRNEDRSPSHYLPMSSKKVWWSCGNGHEWQAAIFTRVLGSGCPHCRKLKNSFRSFI